MNNKTTNQEPTANESDVMTISLKFGSKDSILNRDNETAVSLGEGVKGWDIVAFHSVHAETWEEMKDLSISTIRAKMTGYKIPSSEITMCGSMDYIKERADGSRDGEIRQIFEFNQKYFRLMSIENFQEIEKETGATYVCMDLGYSTDGKRTRVVKVLICWKTVDFITQEAV